jgi:NADH dehydrogenase
MNADRPERIVIVGSGFAGYFAARRLVKKAPSHLASVTIVTDSDSMLH